MRDDDSSPIPAREAKQLFADWQSAPALILAVSGGPDSVALLWLAARWRRALKRGPALLAVTLDHGLRPEAAREARDVRRLAASLDIPHRTLRWTGAKPSAGLPAAAREARYRLLARAAKRHKATHILTAHTRDDQAETLLMRMARGSGLAGLAAMARQTRLDGVVLARPFLGVPKARLIATLAKAKVGFAEDPTNQDPHFTRPRWRALMPKLAAEGFDSRNLARLATRLARANVALEGLVDGAEQFLALRSGAARPGIDACGFAGLTEEVRLRLLLRMIGRVGHEGPAGLGQAEALLAAIDRAMLAANKGIRLKQTLAGALITLSHDRLRIDPAPRRRRRD
ncbi:tRNA lysidine(34) synthetase TilS [Tardiphaga sp. vice352]|uniref:tRNA lysidine(34) synthetase TilS n=1 Tax=unclassified Tardiphaga TaxID=2631404 RepID=UPI0011639924|nr:MULTISPECIES: tRNA lysidine(34) synthetase TilS [unclassified Tardiphaga]QDM18383.1 tRNA lysidine(34) synthetase TilS [Tardiphaga sp. vice278]QDM23387.1 tRNA lysidine(34) synthetase TilS [Tardiphaga sp. vice154]QDM28607.1 tRNA lysidine(34) synthetase TilS [Tardiphaga sp. vice304]QDM33707.1 tRNA lysidine(34) synthetase TilS [Tardiphaga sp. vice352]